MEAFAAHFEEDGDMPAASSAPIMFMRPVAILHHSDLWCISAVVIWTWSDLRIALGHAVEHGFAAPCGLED